MAATAKRPEIIELSRGLRGTPQCEDYERMISGMMYVSSSRDIHAMKMGTIVADGRGVGLGITPTRPSCSRLGTSAAA